MQHLLLSTREGGFLDFVWGSFPTRGKGDSFFGSDFSCEIEGGVATGVVGVLGVDG